MSVDAGCNHIYSDDTLTRREGVREIVCLGSALCETTHCLTSVPLKQLTQRLMSFCPRIIADPHLPHWTPYTLIGDSTH